MVSAGGQRLYRREDRPRQRPPIVSSHSLLHLRIVWKAKRAVLSRSEQRSSLFLVGIRDHDLNHSEAVNSKPVSLPQRFASQLAGDAGRCQKSLDLLRLYFPARGEHADFILHEQPRFVLPYGLLERSSPSTSAGRSAR